jgi:hypothetical protein
MVDFKILLQSPASEIATYLRDEVKIQHPDEISKELFIAAEKDLIPPTVVDVWISVAPQAGNTLPLALRQQFSVNLRSTAIKRFAKQLRGERYCSQNWAALGGTQGVLDLLKEFSITHLKDFLRQILRRMNGGQSDAKRVIVTELLKGLLPDLYPDSEFKTTDTRPLISTYAMLVPSCTADFVDELLLDENSPLLKSALERSSFAAQLLKQHPGILRLKCNETIFEQKDSKTIKPLVYLPGILEAKKYQDTPSAIPGWSESMRYSADLLKELTAQPEAEVKGHNVITILIEPLFAKAKKRRFVAAMMGELVDLYIAYLSARPAERRFLQLNGTFVCLLVRCWAQYTQERAAFEVQLVTILNFIPSEYRQTDHGTYRELIKLVLGKLRWQLLRLSIMHTYKDNLDIENIADLRKVDTKSWSISLLQTLDYPWNLTLLRNLIEIHGDDDFLGAERWSTNSVFTDRTQNTERGDTVSFLIDLEVTNLEPGSHDAIERARHQIELQKSKANKCREQTERAFHARNVLRYSYLSGSLQLFGETLKYLNRFVRDPLTVKTLFAREILSNAKSIRLLSGVPLEYKRCDKKKLDLEMVHNRVMEANALIFSLFETACSALKEPSFSPSDWEPATKLLGPVIGKRLNLARDLHENNGVTDKQLWNIFWNDSLELAIRIERICLEPEFERLHMNTTLSPLKFGYSLNKSGELTSTFRFIEDYAKARDELWREHRLTLNASAVVIPSPLPRGLPIQCLDEVNVCCEVAHGATPWLLVRAKAVVFADPDSLAPITEDGDLLKAIGRFVDDYFFALQLYVKQGPTEEARKERIIEAWNHAINKLSPGMTDEEAHRQWRIKFQRETLGDVKIPDPDRERWKPASYPIMPFDSDDTIFQEWDPMDEFRPLSEIKSRRLEPVTYMDCSVYGEGRSTSYFKESDAFIRPMPSTVFVPGQAGDLWELERLTKKQTRQPEIREGFIIAALQYLELRLEPATGNEYILSRAFPEEANYRYPSIWLDESTIDKKKTDISGPVHLLKCLSDTTPPTLLRKLTASAYGKLVKAGPEESTAQLGEIVYRVVSLLAHSDRPHLAYPFILRSMVELPSASAWHRQLLSISFLNKLSPAQAKDFFRLFAESISDNLKLQAQKKATAKAKPEVVHDAPPEKKETFVKITTIKYLAQLLHSQSWIPTDFSINILVQLFKDSNHIDVRVAIVNSIIGMLEATAIGGMEKLAEQLITALEMTIPIASRFDEAVNFDSSDWAEAKRTGILPEPFNISSSSPDASMPPLFELVERATGYKFSSSVRSEIVDRILVPIIHGSTESNTRWLELFTSNHNVDFQSLSLPLFPVKPVFLKKHLEQAQTVRKEILDLYYSFLVVNIQPPDQVLAFNKRLRDDPKLRNLPDTKHWLSLYGHGNTIYSYDGLLFASLPTRLHHTSHLSQVQSQTLSLFKILLNHSAYSATSFCNPLQPPYLKDDKEMRVWETAARPILQKVVSMVDGLRTEAWQQSNARTPKTLPATSTWKSWLLPYPSLYANQEDIRHFTLAYRSFLAHILADPQPYYHHLPIIKFPLERLLPVDRSEVACLLGKLHDDMTQLDYLGVELAQQLFLKAEVPLHQGVTEEAREIMEQWRRSPIEWIRALGRKMVARATFENKEWGMAVVEEGMFTDFAIREDRCEGYVDEVGMWEFTGQELIRRRNEEDMIDYTDEESGSSSDSETDSDLM